MCGCCRFAVVLISARNRSAPTTAATSGFKTLSATFRSCLAPRFENQRPEGDVCRRTELLLSPIQLLERFARLIPPPRIHRHRYHGVLAPNAKLRAAVTHIGRPDAETPGAQLPTPSPQPSIDAEPSRPTNPARIRWAVLLARIYDVLPLLCPACGPRLARRPLSARPRRPSSASHDTPRPTPPPPSIGRL